MKAYVVYIGSSESRLQPEGGLLKKGRGLAPFKPPRICCEICRETVSSDLSRDGNLKCR